MSADPSHSNTVFTNDVEFGHVTGFDVEDFDDMGGFDVLGSSQMEAPTFTVTGHAYTRGTPAPSRWVSRPFHVLYRPRVSA